MNKAETIQVITLLVGNYDNIAKKDRDQKQLMVNTWQECLGDLDYKLVLQAVKKTIIESPYPPTIHEIRKNAVEIVTPTSNKTGIEAWSEAYKMICSGTRITQEEFDKASPEVKKFFGSISQLRAYATNEDFNLDVTRSNFLKQFEIIKQRDDAEKLLPKDMKNLIGQAVEKMSVNQIGE